MKKTLLLLLTLVISIACSTNNKKENGKTTISIPSENSINLKADFYPAENTTKPLLLLFHQAKYSRGEYIETAPKLNELGFGCLAIDQRSGFEVNGITNQAFKDASSKNLGTEYTDAIVDLRAAIEYVKNENLANEVILVGSSYSSSLIFILANEYPNFVKGIAAFSPGEYFTYNNKSISEYAASLNVPVFVTSAKNEQQYWAPIYDSVKEPKQFFLPESKGFHGSQALWSRNQGNEYYWEAFKKFLSQF